MLKRFYALPKQIRYLLIAFFTLFALLLAFNIFKKGLMRYFMNHYEPPAVTVASVQVQETSWRPNLHAVGEFLAVHGVDVNSEASGNIVEIHFKSGEQVEKNQLLVKLDDSVDQAVLKSYEANLAYQKINYKRQVQLLRRNATSQSEVDAAQAEMLQSEGNVEQTKATIAQKHIRSPFRGKLGIRQINLGEYVMPSKTIIVTLQSLDPMFIDFYMPEQYLPKIRAGQNIYFQVEAAPDKTFAGKISAIDAKVDGQTHNIMVRATVPNCPESVFTTESENITCDTKNNTNEKVDQFAFLPGMFVSMDIEQPAIEKALVLPSTAIAYSLYGDSVFVIEKNADKQMVVRRVFVKTGDKQGNLVRITDGLKAGQTVVSAGEVKLKNGTPVVINNEVALNMTQISTLSNE